MFFFVILEPERPSPLSFPLLDLPVQKFGVNKIFLRHLFRKDTNSKDF